MGALVGLGFGLGALLIWSAFATPRAPRPAATTPGRLERMLAEAGLAGVSPRSLLLLCGATGAVVCLTVLAVSRTTPLAVVVGALAAYLPVAVLSGRVRTRRREYAEVWPEAVDDLASAVRAGMSLPDAVAALAVRGPEPLRPAFEAFALDYQVSGRFGDCLDRLKGRLADPVGDRVVEGLRVAREVGGGELGRLLRNLSGYLRDDLRTRSELEARQSWTINGARLANGVQEDVCCVRSFP
ncbi:type II secretion system F family protein [Nocardioides antri]|uniref:Type II secretion system protein F n=1 Tax=Nocardioides antri TaxID=2607659 RepID=A0A5B1LXL6_9ACTN|nr:type II secretion system F family protein [Nocardioides antri]KAA1424327.1 type II secretion system protein F [Nocardioides antri]